MLNALPRAPSPNLFPAADFWHVDSSSGRPLARFKEWSHFSVLGDCFDLLVNFSLVHRGEPRPGTIPRLVLLFRDAEGAWDGDVEVFEPEEASIVAGSPDAAMGPNSIRFSRGVYHVCVSLSRRDVRLALDLVPAARPLIADNVRLSETDSFRWVVVPRLRADGEAIVSGRRHPVIDAPAYHDRNSGCFSWGGAFAWEWATILPLDPGQPWCLVYSRIVGRHRGAALSQSLLLWRRETLARKFYARDLSISHQGLLGRKCGLCLPRVASLLVPEAADVPQHIHASARGYGDELSLRMSFSDFAQIVTPNDRWPGLTSLFEIQGRAEVTGRIGGEHVAFEARVQAELNHAVG
jgi:hypothetical protein